jgi:hypothetical protein
VSGVTEDVKQVKQFEASLQNVSVMVAFSSTIDISYDHPPPGAADQHAGTAVKAGWAAPISWWRDGRPRW